jgi:hypothetical protein
MTHPEGPASSDEHHARVPWWLHAGAAAFVALMLLLARTRAPLYDALVQEDRLVEWWTFFLFLAAGVAFAVRAARGRRLGDAGVALFCLVAAGEEISWGQRVLGFTPSAAFLEHNAQQEANLHNLVEAFGQPKWTFVAVLVAYGLAAPALARLPAVRALADRLRFSIVPWPLALWFAIASAVLVWYPVRFTGEWIEALGGALFLAASCPRGPMLAGALALTLGAAAAAERGSVHASTRPALVACARAEVRALVADVRDDSLSAIVDGGSRVHRRLFSLWRDGDLDSLGARRFRAAPCPGDPDVAGRRRFGVDPWGTAYWVRAWSEDGRRRIVVYSFGPNRRRDDLTGDAPAGDDVAASAGVR